MPRRRSRNNVFQQLSDARADYNAAKETRFTPRLSGVDPAGSGHSYHIRNERDYLKIVERAREMCRNDIIAGTALSRLTSNVIGEGFSLDVRTGDNSIDDDLRARWKEWSNDADLCHSEGELSFQQMERLGLYSTLRDGDMLFLPLNNGSLQAVENHRLRTPSNTRRNVVHGVLMDNRAKRKEYWIAKQEIGLRYTLRRVSDVRQYPARDANGNRQVLHIYMPERFSQRRGVSALAPVSNLVGVLDDVEWANLLKQQVSSLVVLLSEIDRDSPAGIPGTPLGDITEEAYEGTTRELEGLHAGIHYTGSPGEKLQGFSPNIPSPSFFSHAQHILQLIAINLDLPIVVLLMDASQTNYSGFRGALQSARVKWRQMQKDYIGQFHSPVYKWLVRRWMQQDPILKRALEAEGIDTFGHRFQPPSWESVDPLKDSTADDLQQKSLLNSPRRIQASHGRDWPEVAREIVEDNKMLALLAIEAANEINQTHPDIGITWREMLSLSQSDRQTAMTVLGLEQQQQQGAPQN